MHAYVFMKIRVSNRYGPLCKVTLHNVLKIYCFFFLFHVSDARPNRSNCFLIYNLLSKNVSEDAYSKSEKSIWYFDQVYTHICTNV